MSAPHQKHTPGPWVASPLNDVFFKDVNILDNDGLACAVALRQGDITEDMAKANANLIASAPDLLEALEAVLVIVSVRRVMFGLSDLENKSYAMAAAAINKATGL